MVETEGKHPAARTKTNVRMSAATIIVTRGACEGGTLLTLETARKAGKPYLVIDLEEMPDEEAVAELRAWLERIVPGTLNVAGPRASKNEAIYGDAKAILLAALRGITPG